jgi:hypothetical protein
MLSVQLVLSLQVYTQQLPEEASQADLLLMAAVADAFEMSSASAACVAQLAGLPADALESGTVTAAFTLPDGVAGQESSKQLLQRATERLQQLLGDLELTLRDAAKRQQLEQLPHGALLALLQDQQTRVAAEGTAVAAVALWVAAQEAAGGSVPLEQRQQLAAAIRMVQLPSMYLATVLPSIGWLQGVLPMHHILAFMAAKGVDAKNRRELAESGGFAGDSAAEADTWMTWLAADAREQSGCDKVTVTVQVPAHELHAREAGGKAGPWESELVMWGGYEFGVRLELFNARQPMPALILRGTGSTYQHQLHQATAHLDVVFSCLADGAVKAIAHDRSVWLNDVTITLFDKAALDMSDGWQPERLAPFLHDGKLTIRMTVLELLP